MLNNHFLKPIYSLIIFTFSSFAIASATPDATSSATSPTSTSNPPASAVSSTSSSTHTGVQSKTDWLSKLRGVVPEMICKNFTQNESVNKQLKAANIDYDKCVSLIPASFDKCKDKYYSQIPDSIDQDSASKWGKTMGECIGTDFATAHFGNASTTTSSSQQLTKDEWLSKLKAAVPDLICKGFLQDEALGKRLGELNINYDKCITLIPGSIDKCEKELYSQIPATINQENAGKWGHSIGECIGKDFALKHLFNINKDKKQQ